MAMTAEQIDKLPLSPETKNKLKAQAGLPVEIAPQNIPASDPASFQFGLGTPGQFDTSGGPTAAPPPPAGATTLQIDPKQIPVGTVGPQPAPPPQTQFRDVIKATPGGGYTMTSDGGPTLVVPPPTASAPKPGGGGAPAAPAGPAPGTVEWAFNKPEQGMQAIDQSQLDKKKNVTDELADANALAAAGVKNLKANAIEDDQKMQDEFAENEAKRRMVVDTTLAQHDDEAKQLANEKIDSKKFWTNASAGENVLRVIGLIFGAFGGMTNGGVNSAVQVIQSNIDKDIDTQKAQLQNKKEAFMLRRNIFAQKIASFQDERAAEISTRAQFWDTINKQIDAKIAGAKSEEVKQQGELLKSETAAQADKYKLMLQDYAIKKYDALKLQQMQQAQAAQAAQQKKLDAQNEKVFAAGLEVAKERAKALGGTPMVAPDGGLTIGGQTYAAGTPLVLDYKDGKPYVKFEGTETGKKGDTTATVPVFQPDGSVGYVGVPTDSPEAKKTIQEKAEAVSALVDSIQRMKAAAAMGGTWTGEKKLLYEQALTDYMGAKNKAEKFGALDKGTQDILTKGIPATPTWGVGYQSAAQAKQLDAAEAAAKKSLANTTGIYGKKQPGSAPLPLQAPVK